MLLSDGERLTGAYGIEGARMEIADMPPPVRPMDAQMASLSG
jgi:hypothetical protein